MTKMTEVVERYGIELDIISGPDFETDDREWEHSAYKVRLRYTDPSDEDHTLTTPWKQGVGITDDPEAADVLASIVMDARLGAESFEDFCGELGYDTDSRKAYASWEDCKRQAEKYEWFTYSQEMVDDLNEAEH